MMEALVFTPVSMTRTTLRPLVAMTHPLAVGHDVAGGRAAVIRPAFDNVAMWPAGSAYSSAEDLTRFVDALLDSGRVDGRQALPPALFTRLSGEHVAMPGDPGVHYGYGLLSFMQDRPTPLLAAVAQHLECDLAVEVGVVGDQHDAHTTAAERSEDGKAPEPERVRGRADERAADLQNACIPSHAQSTTIAGGNIINKTWTPAGSPYIVKGDVTVPKGAFLNIQAGTVVQLASTDAQGAGFDPYRVEFTVKGTLNVTGQAANVVQFKPDGGWGTDIWYGIVIDSTATAATIAHATITNATNGIRTDAPGSVLSASNVAVDKSLTGVPIQAGTPTLTNVSVSNGTNYGIIVAGAASPTIVSPSLIKNQWGGLFLYSESGTSSATVTNALIRDNTFGVRVYASGSASMSITNATINANGYEGVELDTYGNSASVSATIKNSIITNHKARGIYRSGTGITANVTYSNVWGNLNNNYANSRRAPGASRRTRSTWRPRTISGSRRAASASTRAPQ